MAHNFDDIFSAGTGNEYVYFFAFLFDQLFLVRKGYNEISNRLDHC